jgi:hypothetical protein
MVFDRLRRWRGARLSPRTSTSNVVSGVAHNVVQAGSIGNLFVGGAGDGCLDLAIPALDTPESLLSFANTAVDCVGRTAELAELKRFLTAEWSFSWWVWTGPAGIGKSRLAVELCRYASTREWHAGFLRETDQDEFGHFQAQRPTLLVIRFATGRVSPETRGKTFQRPSNSPQNRVKIAEVQPRSFKVNQAGSIRRIPREDGGTGPLRQSQTDHAVRMFLCFHPYIRSYTGALFKRRCSKNDRRRPVISQILQDLRLANDWYTTVTIMCERVVHDSRIAPWSKISDRSYPAVHHK